MHWWKKNQKFGVMNGNLCLGIFMFFQTGVFDNILTFGALRMAENRYSEVLSATSSLLIDQFANMGIEDDVDDEGARMVTNSILCNLFRVLFKLFK